MNHGDLESVHHVARLAFLAMAARAVAAGEFENDPEIHTVAITVSRSDSEPQSSIDVTFNASNGMPIGGLSL